MKILITSALPYVNNVPHLGNMIGCVLSADVFARYCRSRGRECIYICGTDEYGTATEIKALEEGVTPKEICDKYHKIHKDIYEWFGIKFDMFGRTSTDKHARITQEIFLDLMKNGYVVEDEVEQLFDEKAGMFLADRYIEGTCPFCGYVGARSDQCDKCGKLMHPGELLNPVSKVTKTTPVVRKTKHLFINLPGMEKELAAWISKTSKDGFWSENSINIAKSWLQDGLKKRAITRDLKWGVPVPLKGWENKVFYVWFDAPIGYISITANLTDNWKDWWMDPDGVRLYQFMGKDNVPFHTVIFPSTLMGTKKPWTLLHHISTTEFLNYENGKFSKSRRIGVFGDDAMKSGIPADVWRYHLLANRPEKSDTVFMWGDFADKNNNELLANLGNLVNRTMVFIERYFGSEIPGMTPNEADREFLGMQEKLAKEITNDLDCVRIKDALHKAMAYSKNANRYFQDNKPWESVKGDKARAGTVMAVLANQIRDLAIMVGPYLPATSTDIFRQLSLEQARWDEIGKPLKAGHKVGKPSVLFRKLEPAEMDAMKVRFSGKNEGGECTSFADLDLEVGEIISVERHPDADKLYVEKVRMGDGDIQVVSGLALYYRPEDLVGKKAVIVKNLMPAKLRGVDSQGMLLVAEKDGGVVEILECRECNAGDKVKAEGIESRPKKHIAFKEFGKVDLGVRDFGAEAAGKPLIAGKQRLRTHIIKDGKIC